MKERIIKITEKAISFLEKIKSKYTTSKGSDLDYSSLSPISNSDKDGVYSNALQWALENRKSQDVKNIALTGPYGSGKSSILKTFQKKYDGNDFKFLNISLATFKEEKQGSRNVSAIASKELLRLIETSILQQMFYHEKDKDLPNSRFKRIRNLSGGRMVLYSVGFFLYLLSILNYTDPTLIEYLFLDISINEGLGKFFRYLSLVLILLGSIRIIYLIIRTFGQVTINKFTIQNIELGVTDNMNKSVLNQHIDEILYFFSVRPYNVVIIEDLDRFEETEIFTKLRELNLLLNNSKSTKAGEIVFIYAVRDDMFTDNERTKFFDFVIPVIPVINSSNSSEILLNKNKKYSYGMSRQFIEDISFFIDDMRLLHNITNEFYLYRQMLDKTLEANKLFAIITYKNIYPNDFVELGSNKGVLFQILTSKSTLTAARIEELNADISDLKSEVENSQRHHISSVSDLRKLYMLKAIEVVQNFVSFSLNGKNLEFDELVSNDNFKLFRSDQLIAINLVLNIE